MPKHKPIKFEKTLEPTFLKEVEWIVKENTKAKTILNATLAIVAIGGVLTIGALAPGLIGSLSRMQASKKKSDHEKYQQIWHAFNRLKEQRTLEFVKESGGYMVYRLSKKGKEKIKKLILDELKVKKPKKWDGKWRLVLFDIPETKRRGRNALRNKLVQLGFYQCQKSAWIYPFPCLEEIEFLKQQLGIKPFVKLFLVEEMTDGKVLYYFKDLIKNTIVK